MTNPPSANMHADSELRRFDGMPDLREPGTTLRLWGEGTQSTAYLRSSDLAILKIVKGSMDWSQRERCRRADQMAYEHGLLVASVGPSVVGHEISLAPHPWHPDTEIIQIVQPYRLMKYLKLSDKTHQMPNLQDRLVAFAADHPRLPDQLAGLVDTSRRLYREYGLSTDIGKERNQGIDLEAADFVCIDAQPVTYEYPTVQANISTYLDNIEIALEVLASS